MTILDLDAVWLNLLTSGQAVTAQALRGRKSAWQQDGEVRGYVSGRRRAFTVVGEAGTVDLTLCGLTAADVDTLRNWKGQTVQIRDPRGQLWVGVYFTVALEEIRPLLSACDAGGGYYGYNATLRLQTVTSPAGV